MLVLQIGSALALTMVSAYTVSQGIQARMSADLREHGVLLQAVVAPLMLQRNQAALDRLFERLAATGRYRYLEIADTQGQLALRSARDGNPDDPLIAETFPLEADGRMLGTLRIGWSTQHYADYRRAMLQRWVGVFIAILIAASLLVATAANWLTRPLRRVAAAVSRFGNDDQLATRLPVETDDEVGRVAIAFNSMADTLQERVRSLAAGESKFNAIANYTHGCESWVDPAGTLLWINPSVERLTGYRPDQCQRPDFPAFLVHEADRAQMVDRWRKAIQSATTEADIECRIRRHDGTEVWTIWTWQPIYGPEGDYQGLRASMESIQQRKDAQFALEASIIRVSASEIRQKGLLEQLKLEHARLDALLSAMAQGILFADLDGHLVYANPAFQRLWLLRDGMEVIGAPLSAILAQAGNYPPTEDGRNSLEMLLSPGEAPLQTEITLADSRIVATSRFLVRDPNGQPFGVLWMFDDVTPARQTARQLIYLAERDALTGLSNRHKFQEALSRMASAAERSRSPLALLFFDLDEFKHINDTFGHRAGDAVLIRVASEVAQQVRSNELFARLGGDEFAVLVPDAELNGVAKLAERIVQTVAQIAVVFEGQRLRLTTSLGIAMFPEHARGTEDLVALADTAMYQAKDAGKNQWRVYRADLDTSRQILQRLSWAERIANAFDHDLFRLYFQGIYCTNTGRLKHLECLLRMADEHDPHRVTMPGQFIPAAEKTGKILEIDRWVIAAAVKLLRAHAELPALAVNISGRSFDDPGLPAYIAGQLEGSGVAPQRLLLELTETSAVSDLQDAQRFIGALRTLGCVICLDDFGSGFSSFAYLKHLNADILKIDGLFIQNLPGDRDNQVFVRAIVEVARGMGITTVAEFVEDAATFTLLREFGVDYVQGYYLDRPSPDHPGLHREHAFDAV